MMSKSHRANHTEHRSGSVNMFAVLPPLATTSWATRHSEGLLFDAHQKIPTSAERTYGTFTRQGMRQGFASVGRSFRARLADVAELVGNPRCLLMLCFLFWFSIANGCFQGTVAIWFKETFDYRSATYSSCSEQCCVCTWTQETCHKRTCQERPACCWRG